MKKIIVTIFLLWMGVQMYAQNSWEIKEARNNTLYVGANLMTIPLEERNMNPIGAMAGYARTLNIGGDFCITGGVELQYLSGSVDFKKETVPYRQSAQIIYGRVPVNFGYVFGLEHNQAIHVHAGGNVQYQLAADNKLRNYSKENLEYDLDPYMTRKLNVGLQAGADFDFNEEWFAGAEFYYYLTATGKKTDVLSDSHAYGFTFRVGYRF